MDGIGRFGGGTQVVAHRGFHAGGLDENSLPAFEAAAQLGADVLELDIHRTRDGVLVVHHDAHVRDGRRIADLNFAELPRLPHGAAIPTLVEVADLANRTGVRVAAELKEPGYESLAVQQLVTHMPRERVEMISFNRDSIRAVERLDPTLTTGLLEPSLPAWLRATALYPAAMWLLDRLGLHLSIDAAAAVGADYVSIEQTAATDEFIAEAHERGMGVDVWTVDDVPTMRRLVAAGVRGIVTDRPDLLRRLT